MRKVAILPHGLSAVGSVPTHAEYAGQGGGIAHSGYPAFLKNTALLVQGYVAKCPAAD